MPPNSKKNGEKGVSYEAFEFPSKTEGKIGEVNSRDQKSTMGKYGSISKTMKLLGMCEDFNVQMLSNVGQNEDCKDQDEITIRLFDTYEDVNALKLKARKFKQMNSAHIDRDNVLNNNECHGCSSLLNDSLEKEEVSDAQLCDGDPYNSDNIDTIPNGIGTATVKTTSLDLPSKMGRDRSVSDSMLLNRDISKVKNKEHEIRHERMKAGLLMSPIALTQDLPVSIETDQNRLSLVMENMSLVYLPTTKQLVSGQISTGENGVESQDATCSNATPKKAVTDKQLSVDSHCIYNDDFEETCSELASPQSIPCTSEAFSYHVGPDFVSGKDLDQVTLNSVESLIPHGDAGDQIHRTYNDASSLSSVSTGTDFSVSASFCDDGSEFKTLSLDTDEAGFMDVNLHSRNSYQRSHNQSLELEFANDKGAKSKRKGLSGFLSRNIFSRKNTDNKDGTEGSAPGWKLFGQVPPKTGTDKEPSQISSEYHAKLRASQMAPSRSNKKQDVEVLSTTALILENRPMNLPSKDPEEAEKHRLQYEQMVECARKKEQREYKLKKKQLQNQLKQEDQLAKSSKLWNTEILPNWDTMHSSKKARDLWWYGLPPSVRGKVWRLALGNELNITAELYEICIGRAEERIKLMQDSESMSSYDPSSESQSNKEDSVKVIRLDVSRTFPQLCIFQKGGPYHDLLHSLLGAYATYRPDVGYVQGMSFIAGILLLNLEAADAFICFANLLNRPCQVAFFRMDENMMTAYYKTFEEFFRENLPLLFQHFQKQNMTPNLYLIDWIFLMYSKSLPLDVVCRVWDVFWRDGEEFIFRTALGILKTYEKTLLSLDFIHIAQFLTKLPEDISADELFRNIEPIKMTIDKKKFANILAVHKDYDL